MKRNPEKAREAMRRWRKGHPGEHATEVRSYYQRSPTMRTRSRRYHREHPEVMRAAQIRRRARELGAAGDFTAREWRELVREYNGCCAYCGRPCSSLDADHRVPLALGGTNGISNILPACRRCNLRKHTLTEAEFRARLAAEGHAS